MAYLDVAPELIVKALFKDSAPDVRIIGASFDPLRSIVILEIEGVDVPNADKVTAICSIERFSVRFEPIA